MTKNVHVFCISYVYTSYVFFLLDGGVYFCFISFQSHISLSWSECRLLSVDTISGAQPGWPIGSWSRLLKTFEGFITYNEFASPKLHYTRRFYGSRCEAVVITGLKKHKLNPQNHFGLWIAKYLVKAVFLRVNVRLYLPLKGVTTLLSRTLFTYESLLLAWQLFPVNGSISI